jgi:hypothetical protein
VSADVTPAQLVELISELGAIGTQRIYLRIYDPTDIDQLELMATEVMPQLEHPAGTP